MVQILLIYLKFFKKHSDIYLGKFSQNKSNRTEPSRNNPRKTGTSRTDSKLRADPNQAKSNSVELMTSFKSHCARVDFRF